MGRGEENGQNTKLVGQPKIIAFANQKIYKIYLLQVYNTLIHKINILSAIIFEIDGKYTFAEENVNM